MKQFARASISLFALLLLAGCTAAAGGTDEPSGGSQVRDTGRGGASDTGLSDTTDPLDTTDPRDTAPGSGSGGDDTGAAPIGRIPADRWGQYPGLGGGLVSVQVGLGVDGAGATRCWVSFRRSVATAGSFRE